MRSDYGGFWQSLQGPNRAERRHMTREEALRWEHEQPWWSRRAKNRLHPDMKTDREIRRERVTANADTP